MAPGPDDPSDAAGLGDGPPEVTEYAAQTVEYVRRALGVTLEFNSETLPVLDHYLKGVPSEKAAAAHLVAATAGAYFGEVVRRRVGGSWQLPSRDPGSWRLVLPSGLWFFPAAMALATILGPEGDEEIEQPEPGEDPEHTDIVTDEWDATLQAPPALRAQVARVLEGMADVSAEEYYTLCCRLDTIEHVQAVLTAAAAAARKGGGHSHS